jgi:hypothetical protein
VAHMIFRAGKMLDLDALILGGKPARSYSRDELEVRLRKLGVPLSHGMGRDSMLELAAPVLQRLVKPSTVGRGDPPEAA